MNQNEFDYLAKLLLKKTTSLRIGCFKIQKFQDNLYNAYDESNNTLIASGQSILECFQKLNDGGFIGEN